MVLTPYVHVGRMNKKKKKCSRQNQEGRDQGEDSEQDG